MLGRFAVMKSGSEVPVRDGGKAQGLLVRLALGPRAGIHREKLIAGLWPEREAPLAGQSLNSLVYSLHRLLGDEIDGAAPVVQGGGFCRLNFEAGIAVDLVYFEEFIQEGGRLDRAGDAPKAVRAYRQAVDCYRGDLTDDGELNAVIERERFRSMYLTALARLADYSFYAGDYRESLESALQLLLQDPCREDAHRLVMRCHVRSGERGQALRQYRVCEKILSAEFQAPPEPLTRALFEEIRLDPSAV
jgi:DNA-binding SARP family transcriptional activator